MDMERGRQRACIQYSRGEAIFRGECASCHTMGGYRSLRLLLDGRDRAGIGNFLVMLHDYKPDSPYPPFHAAASRHQAGRRRPHNYLNTQVNPPAPKKPLLTAQK